MTHQQIFNLIWKICELLRGHYDRHKFRDVILPMTVLRRLDCVLASTKAGVLATNQLPATMPDDVREGLLKAKSGFPFYNTSRFDFKLLLNSPNQIAKDLRDYIRGFSENIQEIMERFEFSSQIDKLNEKGILYEIVKEFAAVDLSPKKVDNMQMGYAFEELIRIGAEQSNAEAGDHFTPREVIQLMTRLLLSSDPDLGKSHVIKTIYDPACGTGGMLSVAEVYIKERSPTAMPFLFGQDINDASWAVCKSDMLLKGQDAENIVLGNSLTDEDGFTGGNSLSEEEDPFQGNSSKPSTFDYMLANPPFGVSWKAYKQSIEKERDTKGYEGRYGAGTPRISDGSLLFLQHMISKMQPVSEGGSRIAIVFNGSPLFSGDAGSGESEIRRWIIENDWLEAIVALPDQMFYNTGISTYVWILTNRKEPNRVGKIQLIDGREFYQKMRKSLGNKRNELSDAHIDELTEIHGNFRDGETRDLTDGETRDLTDGETRDLTDGETRDLTYEDPITHSARKRPPVVSKVFANKDFGFRKITVERPLRLNFAAVPERIARIEDDAAFRRLAVSKKKDQRARDAAVAEGRARQQELRQFLEALSEQTGGRTIHDREAFNSELSATVATTGVKLTKAERDMILEALGERDPDAAICRNRSGKVEADPELRDTETVPLSERIDDFMAREVHPHHPDAWVDDAKTKVGYEIPFNRHFFEYEPPRPLEVIRADMQELEREFAKLLAEVAG